MRTLALLLLILCWTPAWSQPSVEPAKTSTPSSPSTEALPPGPVTHEFTDAEWAAFEEEVWQAEQKAIQDAVVAAVEPHKKYELAIISEATTWKLVSAGEGAAVLALLLVLLLK